MTTLSHKHLLGLEGYSAAELNLILDTAESFKEVSERPVRKVPALRGKTIVNLFFENSTRTRISFELAEKRLSDWRNRGKEKGKQRGATAVKKR